MTDPGFKLMIPGPVTVSPEVLAVMSKPIVPHYGDEFVNFYEETLGLLRQVFQTDQDLYLMVGSGTAAIDACVGSALNTGDKIIVGTNGFFGDRLIWIAQGNGLQVIPVHAKLGVPLDPGDFEKALQTNPDAKAIIIVHLETATTIINPVEDIAKIAREHNVLMMVDAVSSIGGVKLKFDDWGLDLVATSINKCIGAPPGLAPVAVSRRAWEVIVQKPEKYHGWYSDLRTWRKYATEWADWHPTPVTMPVNNINALHVALRQLIDEGIENRLARFTGLAKMLREGLVDIGMLPYTPDHLLNPVLTAAYAPDGVQAGEIVSYLANKHRIKISGGLGELKERVFRIGHMSPMVTERDITEVLDALRQFPD